MRQPKLSADWKIVDFAFVAEHLGYADELRRLIEQLPRTKWSAANLALVAGDFGTAADLFLEIGTHFPAADARMRAAVKLEREGRRREAEEELEKALSFYRSVGATRYIRQGEALLAAAG